MTIKLRSQKIEIDLPKEDLPPWVHATIQRVVRDDEGKPLHTTDMVDHIYRELTSFGTDIKTVKDPVTGADINLSGYGLAEAVRVFVVDWIQEKHGGDINESGELIVG